MAVNLKKTLRCELVRNGRILDSEKTLAMVRELLQTLTTAETLSDEDKETIDAALTSFEADNKANAYPLPVIASVVANRYLDVPLNLLPATEEKIKARIRSDEDRFYIAKGPKGGVRFVSRFTDEERKEWQTKRDAAALADDAQ